MVVSLTAHAKEETKDAVFAGGCFWCMQPPFDRAPGVLRTEVGYTGGHTPHPDYARVSSGKTGHVEAIRVVYDPGRTSYRDLLEIYWRTIDPTQGDGQFADRGPQYRPVIFYADDAERRWAEASMREVQRRFARPVVVRLQARAHFYPAEDWHQRYYLTHPDAYRAYKEASGRGAFLRRMWGEEMSDE